MIVPRTRTYQKEIEEPAQQTSKTLSVSRTHYMHMHNEQSRERLFGLLVAVIAFIVYLNSLGNGFTLDDHAVILDARELDGNALKLFTMIDAVADTQKLPFYRPLANITFLFDGRLHGFNPFFIRLFNVLFHAANAFLVYRVARLLFKDNIHPPLLVGLLFAVHPLHTEGVDFNAGGRITIMACFFSLASYLVHDRSITHQRTSFAFAGAFLFLAGLLSKEIAMMILPFIVAVELVNLRNSSRDIRATAYLRLTPYFIASTIYLVMRWLTLSKLGIQAGILPGVGSKIIETIYITTDLGTRMMNNIYIIPRYLLMVIWPTSLANRYVIPDDLNLLALPLIGAWIFILVCLGWLFTKGRSAISLFGISWLIMFWLPVSGIVFVPGAPFADRFFYIPAIGVWIVVADQLFRFLPTTNATFRKFGPIAAVLLLSLLAAVTMTRNLDWESDLTLHTRFVAQYPDNVHANVGLGKVYYSAGKEQHLVLAENVFDKAIDLDPNYPMIQTYLGNINLNLEDLDDALHHYNRALEVFPNDKEARLNRGITLEKLGRQKEALNDYIFFLTSHGADNLPGGRRYAAERVKVLSRSDQPAGP